MRTRGFTLMEILIVVALLGIMAATMLALFNPKQQIARAWDGQRTHELSLLTTVYEDFYNDHSAYPIDTEVCTSPVEVSGDTCSCYICGSDDASADFSPYLGRLPCDPQYPSKKYLYQYQCSAGQWYKLYAELSSETAQGGYNFGVASSNTTVEPYPTAEPTVALTPPPGSSPTPTQPVPTNTPVPQSTPTSTPMPTNTPTPSVTPSPTPAYPPCPDDPVSKYCFKDTACNNCGTFANCERPSICNSPVELYSDGVPGCTAHCSAP